MILIRLNLIGETSGESFGGGDDPGPALYRAFEMKDWNQVFQLAEMVSEWADKLWAMSVREGQIGPAPFYQEV